MKSFFVRIKIIFGFLSLIIPLISQGQVGVGEFRNFRSLTTENGMPSNNIRCFVSDHEGYMWIGTTNGLVRYDGSEVLIFQNDPENPKSISGNNISALEMEGDSIIWVGTLRDGLNRFDIKTRTFQRFVPEQDRPNSIPTREVYAIKHDARGDLWIGYNRDGFGRYNRETSSFEQIKITSLENDYSTRQSNVIKNFIIDKIDSNKIWIITLTSLIEYNIETGNLTSRNPYDENPLSVENRLLGFHQGIQSEGGQIYIACNRYGVWVFDPSTVSWKNYSEKRINPKDPSENSFNLIEEMGGGNFWLSSKKRGMYVLDAHTGQILPFEQSHDPESSENIPENVNVWRLGNAEGYWFGSDNGVKLFNKQGNQFELYRHQPEAEWLIGKQSISALYTLNEDEIYFGGYAGEGIYRYNLTTRKKILIKPPNPIENSEAKMFFLRDFAKLNDSTLLILTYDALYKLDQKTEKLSVVKTEFKFGKDYFTLNRIFQHSDGSFYISTRYSGVFVLDSALQFSRHLKADAQHPNQSIISSSYINKICEDPDGMVWIGTEDGFSKWNPKENTFLNFDLNTRRDSTPMLKTIFRIALAPDSSLWFVDAFDHGVFLEYPYELPYNFKPIYTGNEGRRDRINNFLFSTSGKTILATAAGLSITNKDGSFRRFTDKEGLPKMAALAPIIEMPDGRIVMAARNQLVSFYPDILYYTPKQNDLHLSSIAIFDKILDARMDSIMEHGLQLTYLQNFFTLNLSLLNFDNPEEFRLSYRLNGFSDEWITTHGKSAVFTNVPGGKYTFEARLIDKNNTVAQEVLMLPVTMIPPAWEMWWFRLLVIVLIAGALLLSVISRMRIIRRKAAFEMEMANMEMVVLRAQMNPHFIFNSLNSIRHQIITNRNEDAEKYLVKFSKLIRWILENSESHYIKLEDELIALRLYLELESKRFDDKFIYKVNIDPSIDTSRLEVPGIIIQPFVENAIWHGLMQKKHLGTVTIDLHKTESSLIIKITDDGIGREKAQQIKSKTGQNRNSMGVKITTSRLEAITKIYKIPCSAIIEDLKNERGEPSGTRVTVTLPLIHSISVDA